ncbi:MAG TPA: MarR family winged helix-turn-helix transcriptional regulator [Victivallis vadensis]|nr:MarR family winged helix-turn-helix transcriptional regulator [Victivallis vadensis]
MARNKASDPERFFLIYRELCRAWKIYLKEHFSKAATPHAGFRTLHLCFYIFRHPECSLREVAEIAGLSAGAASALVDALCDSGLLNRAPSPADRRRICLTVTPAIAAFLEQVGRFC